ncbi:MAG TPA: translation elongation factor Ts [Candidatus Phocaeicola gallinarum]|uniref:Elongation factor Ts n=2 Tax=Bacteroidaceae TaxID=815 RepID=A0ABS2F6F2_9BACE|nr:MULTISPECIES: translation elongation factor Ts [Bacteroidaceae]MBD8002804.1 elongation factor Ts [Phocaeicola faecium]MBM6805822.1 elongation factor Ts [Bacteroides caecicola]MCL1626908.1 translation elongation factor Ts [Bacteroides caecicola]HJC95945.1 translation elongation factor Ts [Candidatus Phocaeicola gallinarum]
MAVSMADIQHLRKMTGAGMMDCKNALTEAEGNFDKAMEIIRKKGQAVAAKRSDRETSEGCVLAKSTGDYAAMIALKCETDFVAKNSDFVALTQAILDAAIANKCQTIDEIKALPMGNGTVADAIVERSGITGEKTELDGYNFVSGACTAIYNHQNKNQLCTLVAFNKACDEKVAHEICMQIAAMSPIAIDEAGVPADVLAREKEIAADKARQEGKPENMIEKIAMGRLGKFYKEVCLLKQESIMDPKKTVADVLKAADPELAVVDFKRFTLRAE